MSNEFHLTEVASHQWHLFRCQADGPRRLIDDYLKGKIEACRDTLEKCSPDSLIANQARLAVYREMEKLLENPRTPRLK